ncbi:hypothetical protein [Halalkalibacter kiskunsagensis]|uniref:hypothetical protein n=1 Tax=Halalkalibacter kiskunsagensis TaxID=1548599 RepID=UPI0030097C35
MAKRVLAFKKKLQEHKTVLTATPVGALFLIVFLVRSDILPEVFIEKSRLHFLHGECHHVHHSLDFKTKEDTKAYPNNK